jgi:hypothetical protein
MTLHPEAEAKNLRSEALVAEVAAMAAAHPPARRTWNLPMSLVWLLIPKVSALTLLLNAFRLASLLEVLNMLRIDYIDNLCKSSVLYNICA